MSEGGYNSALDMWSLGCIFGELLQRVPLVGSATTPQLTVAPLFAIHGLPKTPQEGCEPTLHLILMLDTSCPIILRSIASCFVFLT